MATTLRRSGSGGRRSIPALDKLKLDGDDAIGVSIVRKALEAPARQIADNAGAPGEVVVERLRSEKAGHGFGALRGEYVDMFKSGIVDAAKVTRSALQNAASIAAMVLTTETLITDIPEERPAPAGAGAGFGGDMDFDPGFRRQRLAIPRLITAGRRFRTKARANVPGGHLGTGSTLVDDFVCLRHVDAVDLFRAGAYAHGDGPMALALRYTHGNNWPGDGQTRDCLIAALVPHLRLLGTVPIDAPYGQFAWLAAHQTRQPCPRVP